MEVGQPYDGPDSDHIAAAIAAVSLYLAAELSPEEENGASSPNLWAQAGRFEALGLDVDLIGLRRGWGSAD
ncbi:MAG TPA: hypothetical protein VF221_02100 [Chloroflexota bacterium]